MANDTLTLTLVRDGEDVWSHSRTRIFDVTLSDAYVTDGYTMSPHRVGLSRIAGVSVLAVNTAAVGYTVQYNATTGKLIVLTGALAQPAGDTPLDTLTLRLLYIGE